MAASISRCQKFQANIFDKNKCQNCFQPKERHSAKALECSKVARKISKCGYLFVAPESFDFTNPLDKTRRWQRRFFVLYDDGELSYSVDENVNTVPQGIIDMNFCTDVFDAENITTHQFSIAVATSTRYTYIKGTSKEETTRWYDVLVMYPRSTKTKTRRAPAYSQTPVISPPLDTPTVEMIQTSSTDQPEESDTTNAMTHYSSGDRQGLNQTYTSLRSPPAHNSEGYNAWQDSATSVPQRENAEHERGPDSRHASGIITYRGIRGLKHKNDKSHNGGLRKSNSIPDLRSSLENLQDGNISHETEANSDYKENLYGTFPRRRGVSARQRVFANPTDIDDTVDPFDFATANDCNVQTRPKTLFESLLNPDPPPKPLPKNYKYLKLAGIPQTRPIENYVGAELDEKVTPAKKLAPPPWKSKIQIKSPGAIGTGPFASTPANGPQHGSDKGYQGGSHSAPMKKNDFNQINSLSTNDSNYYQLSHSKSSNTKSDSVSTPKRVRIRDQGLNSRTSHSIGQEKNDRPSILDMGSTTSSQSKYRDQELNRRARESQSLETPRSSRGSEQSQRSQSTTSPNGFEMNGRTKNETDEYKMSKSGDLSSQGVDSSSSSLQIRGSTSSTSNGRIASRRDHLDDLKYMKKGWLVKQGATDKEWKKHWYVLSGSTLKFFEDSKAEDKDQVEGFIDISSCFNVEEANVSRSFGFRIQTRDGTYVLSAMTSGIRNNWIQALKQCMQANGNTSAPAQRKISDSQERRISPERSLRRHTDLGLTNGSSSVHDNIPALAKDSRSSGIDGGRRRKTLSSAESLSGVNKEPTSTWPYSRGESREKNSPVRNTPRTVKNRKPSVDRQRRRSDVSEYVAEQEQDIRQRELSPEQEEELDHVERNIRKIHRRSMSEIAQQQRPQHFDKFETTHYSTTHDGSVSSSKPNNKSNNNEDVFYDSPPSRLRKDHTHTTRKGSESEKARSPSHPRAPSAKVKDKSRSKSPRPKSPPPVVHNDEVDFSFEQAVRKNSSQLFDTSGMDDLIEKKWKEVEKSPKRRLRDPNSRDGSSVGGSEAALVELLETEVETLKDQLEGTQKQMVELHQTNMELKSHLRTTRKDHMDNMEDLESDQSRYLSQIEELQTQMEHATSYLQSKLAEQETRSQIASSQMQLSQKQLQEAHDKIAAQKSEITTLSTKLELTKAEYSQTQNIFDQAQSQTEAEKHSSRKEAAKWKQEIKQLQNRIEELQGQSSQKSSSGNELQQKIQMLEQELADKSLEIRGLHKSLGQLSNVKIKLNEKEEEMMEITGELNHLRQELKDKKDFHEIMNEERTKEFSGMQNHFAEEKIALESQVKKYKQQLEKLMKKSNMSDSLNTNMADILHEKDETIAQLEEKVIENDSKMEALKEELAVEIDENTQLQQTLDQAYEEGANWKRELDQIRAENELNDVDDTIRQELHEVRNKLKELTAENQLLKQDVERQDAEMKELERENEKVTDMVEDYRHQADDYKQRYDVLQKEMEEQGVDMVHTKQELRDQEKTMKQFETMHELTVHDLNKACEKIEELKDDLESERERYEAELKEKEEQLKQTNRQLQEMDKKYATMEESLTDQLQMLDSTENEKTSKFKALAKEHEILRTEHKESMEEVEKLDRVLKETQDNVQYLEKEKGELSEEYATLKQNSQREVELLQVQLKDANDKLSNIEKKVCQQEKKEARRGVLLHAVQSPQIEATHEVSLKAELQQSLETPLDEDELGSSQGSSGSFVTAGLEERNRLLEQISEANEKLRQFEDRLVDQSTLIVEVRTHKNDVSLLKEENEKYLQQIEKLITQLEACQTLDNKSKLDLSNNLVDLEFKLESSQDTLKQCKSRLSDVVQELGTHNIIPTKDNYTSTIESLQGRLRSVLKEVETSSQRLDKQGQNLNISEADRLRMFAEKLSLEAVLIGQMAFLVRNNQNTMYPGKEQQLLDLCTANGKIAGLEKQLLVLSGERKASLADGSANPEQNYAMCLSQKITLEGQLAMLVEDVDFPSAAIETLDKIMPGDKTSVMLAQEALVKGKLVGAMDSATQELYTGSLASRVLTQGEIAFMLEKLYGRLNAMDGQQTEAVQKYIMKVLEQLEHKERQLSNLVSEYKDQKLKEVSILTTPKEGKELENSSELLEKEFSLLVEQFVKAGVGETAGQSHLDQQRQEHINLSVQRELKTSSLALTEAIASKGEWRSNVEQEKTEFLVEFADIVAQKAVLSGHIAYLREQFDDNTAKTVKRRDSGIHEHGSLPMSPTGYGQNSASDIADRLASISVTKQMLAEKLSSDSAVGVGNNDDFLEKVNRLASELFELDHKLMPYTTSVQDLAGCIAREAVFQAQFVYLQEVIRARYQAEIATLQHKLEENSKKGREKVCELEKELETLKVLINEKTEAGQDSTVITDKLLDVQAELIQKKSDYENEMEILEQEYSNEIDKLKETLEKTEASYNALQGEKSELSSKYEQQISSLREDCEICKEDFEKLQKEKDNEVVKYEVKLADLEEAFDKARSSHKKEMHGLRLDQEEELDKSRSGHQEELQEKLQEHHKALETFRLSTEAAVEKSKQKEMKKLEEEITKLRQKLEEEAKKHVDELEKLKGEVNGDSSAVAQVELHSKIQQMELQIQNMQTDYEQELLVQKSAHRRELARAKEDMLQLLAATEAKNMQLDEDTIKKKYLKEMGEIKDIYEKGFSSMEKSHQKVLMQMRRTHKRELDLARQEKEQILAEETHATHAALDAMRKAHEAELQKERNKFLDLIAKTYSHSDVESLQNQHEEDLEQIQYQIKQLTEKCTVKCLENAALEEKLELQTKNLKDTRGRMHQLIARNEELNLRISSEIAKFNKWIEKHVPQGEEATAKPSDQVQDMRVAVQVKDLEINQLKEELGESKEQHHRTMQELEDSEEKYQELIDDHNTYKFKQSNKIEELENRLEQQEEDLFTDEDDYRDEATYLETIRESRESPTGSVSSDDETKVERRLETHGAGDGSFKKPLLRTASQNAMSPRRISDIQPKSTKKVSWRLKQPQRAVSSPGLTEKMTAELLAAHPEEGDT